jgi:hypothetical protein
MQVDAVSDKAGHVESARDIGHDREEVAHRIVTLSEAGKVRFIVGVHKSGRFSPSRGHAPGWTWSEGQPLLMIDDADIVQPPAPTVRGQGTGGSGLSTPIPKSRDV